MKLLPGGRDIRVPPGENVLAAALTAGIPLPYSCRAGRCATCKAKLLSGAVSYPDERLPPGIVASEAARGEVLLCQARPQSDLVIETRPAHPGRLEFAECRLQSTEALAFEARKLTLSVVNGTIGARPGQFVDVRNERGEVARLAVIGIAVPALVLESSAGDGALREWLDSAAAHGSLLRVTGPFDRPR